MDPRSGYWFPDSLGPRFPIARLAVPQPFNPALSRHSESSSIPHGGSVTIKNGWRSPRMLAPVSKSSILAGLDAEWADDSGRRETLPRRPARGSQSADRVQEDQAAQRTSAPSAPSS